MSKTLIPGINSTADPDDPWTVSTISNFHRSW